MRFGRKREHSFFLFPFESVYKMCKIHHAPLVSWTLRTCARKDESFVVDISCTLRLLCRCSCKRKRYGYLLHTSVKVHLSGYLMSFTGGTTYDSDGETTYGSDDGGTTYDSSEGTTYGEAAYDDHVIPSVTQHKSNSASTCYVRVKASTTCNSIVSLQIVLLHHSTTRYLVDPKGEAEEPYVCAAVPCDASGHLTEMAIVLLANCTCTAGYHSLCLRHHLRGTHWNRLLTLPWLTRRAVFRHVVNRLADFTPPFRTQGHTYL